MRLTETQFDETYEPTESPAGMGLWEDWELGDTPVNNVWTVVDPGTGTLYALPGYHFVNRLGYCVTARPWESADIEAVYVDPEAFD